QLIREGLNEQETTRLTDLLNHERQDNDIVRQEEVLE
ncbi:unnamed protein product, partial [marine sediment metagenome]